MKTPTKPHPSCPLHCDIPITVIEIPRPRHRWSDVLICPNVETGCDRAFLLPELKDEVNG